MTLLNKRRAQLYKLNREAKRLLDPENFEFNEPTECCFFRRLKCWLNKHPSWQSHFDWNDEPAGEALPPLILLVSKSMKSDYLKFGDILYFRVFPELLNRRVYPKKIAVGGILFVLNEKMQLRIVGIAIYRNDYQGAVFEALKVGLSFMGK